MEGSTGEKTEVGGYGEADEGPSLPSKAQREADEETSSPGPSQTTHLETQEMIKKRTDLSHRHLMLVILEKLNPHEMKRLQFFLTTSPLIQMNRLEDADTQDTVDQMLQIYGSERAVMITLEILRKMRRDDLADEMKRRGLLLDILEQLNPDDLKRFQSLLTAGQPGYPPIPESQLENADSQDTVDQMVQRYDPEGAVKITLKILRCMNRNDLAEEISRRGLLLATLEKLKTHELKKFQFLLTTGQPGYPPIPERNFYYKSVWRDSHLENIHHTVDQMVQRYDSDGAVMITMKILRRMNRTDLAEEMNRRVPRLLSVILEKLNTDDLRRFQSLLTAGQPGYPPIPESQLNTDSQDTVDQMVQRYKHEAVMITMKILRRMNRNDLVEEMRRRGLLLATLEKLNTDDVKKFQSLLTAGQPGYPPIPESQLENADRQETVDQMMQRYDPEGAVMITLKILGRMNRNDLVEKLQRGLKTEGLLLTIVEKLTTDDLKRFQSLLTAGQPGYPPIPESQLENADSQDTVDQMVQRYGCVGAVMITLKILRRMNRNDLAEEMRRRGLLLATLEKMSTDDLKRFQSLLTAGQPGYPPIPESQLENADSQDTVDQMVQRYDSDGAVMITLKTLRKMDRNDLADVMRRRGLLLVTLEKLNPDDLERFQSLLTTGQPGYPPIPERQLENADSQDTVDQMVHRYNSDGAVIITLKILRRMNMNVIAKKLHRNFNSEGLLLDTLEKMNTDDLKKFQSLLTAGQPGYPLIPESQLENADRQETVDQMVQRYDPEGAVIITLKTLRRMNRNDLADEMNRRGLLLAILGKLNTDDLKRFQSLLTAGQPGYPPIPEIQLKNADRQDTVDQMVQRYGCVGAVMITLEILRRMNRNDLADKLQRNLNSEVLLLATLDQLNTEELKRFQSLLTAGQPGYPPIPEIQLENADSQDTVDQMVQRYDPERAVMITLEILRRMDKNYLAEEIRRRGILLATLEKLNTDDLRRFQSLLTTGQPGYLPIPESQLENADSQDTVDQMVQRYDPEGAVMITLKTLRKMDRNDLADVMRRRGLLLNTLEKLNPDDLRRFQSLLTAGQPGYPPIPEIQLENADYQGTVDQMVQRYKPEGAVKITLETLRRLNKNDIFQKLLIHLNYEGPLLDTLEKLTTDDVKRFQSLLTAGQPGYPPIPENHLENADSQDTVDQMVQRYDPEGAVMITLKTLRKMDRNDLAEEMRRRGLLLDTLEKLNTDDLRRFQSLLTAGQPGYPPIPENQLKAADRQETVDQMVQRYEPEGALMITLKILRRMNRNYLVEKLQSNLNSEGLLLATMQKMNPDDLKRFQSLLTAGQPGYPPIPENQLENADSQDTVDQMVQRYDSDGAVKITLEILRRMNRNDLVEEMKIRGSLLATLEKLNTHELKRFQSLLTAGQPGYPPIPENQLKIADRQDTVDQIVQRYDPEGAVRITMKILRMMGQNDLADVMRRRGLLLVTLEKLNPDDVKKFQSLLTAGQPGYPLIPESQLENADRQDTVDQMMQRYDSEGAVMITLKILRRMNRNDLAEQMKRRVLLLTTLEKLTTDDLERFQSLLTTGQPGYPPIPESQLENADRQDTVDQMVQRYDSHGAVKITLEILGIIYRNYLVEKLQRNLNSEGLLLATLKKLNTDDLKRFQSLLTAGQPGYPPIPESQLKNADRQDTVDQMVQRYDPEGAVIITLKTLRRMDRNYLADEMRRRGLLLATLEKLNTHELKRFQSLLTTFSQSAFSERQLRNADRQDTVDQMVQNYGSNGAVKVTLEILKIMNRNDILEKLTLDYNRAGLLLASLEKLNIDDLKMFQALLTAGQPGYPPIPESQLENADRQDTVDHMVQRYDPEGAVMITLKILRMMNRNDLAEEMRRRGLLLATLEKLNPDDLKRFQSLLTAGQPGYPPIPENQLENTDSQDTVDQMVQRYNPEGAVKITQEILRRMDQNDLAEQLWSEDRGIIIETESSKPSSSESSVIVSREEEVDERVLLDPQTQPAVSSTSTSDTETLSSEDRGIQIEPDAPDPGPAMENPAEPMEEEEDHHHAVLPHGDAGMDESQSRSPLTEGREFTPEILDNENQENYRFQCPHAGMFRCRITGLVFVMEGEGELLYRAVSWDRRLLAHSGKRPAGPLFKFTCLKGSACQLHLAHCHIYSAGGCDFLSVAHVTDESMEFILPTMITETHVIINIDGFSAYGNVEDEDAPISPRNALVLFFYQSPVVSDIRSILNVLLLPSNVVIKDVQRERRRRNGDKEVYIESRPHVKLTPEKYYTLSTEPPDKYTIKPKKAEFMTTDYENYFTSFSLFLRTIIEEVSLVLKERDGTESVWEDQVWLSASTRDSAHAGVGKTSTVVSVSDLLLNALEELGRKGLKRFKRLLCQEVLDTFEPFKKGCLENSDELDMVDLMVDKYCDEGAGILTLEILKRMDKNDLAEKLSKKLDGQ